MSWFNPTKQLNTTQPFAHFWQSKEKLIGWNKGMHNTIANCPLSHAKISSLNWDSSLFQLTRTVYILGMTYSRMEYPFCQFGSVILSMLHLSFLCTSSLAECGKQKSPWFGVSTAQQLLKHQCAIQHLILNPKFSTAPATEKIWTLFLWKPGQEFKHSGGDES